MQSTGLDNTFDGVCVEHLSVTHEDARRSLVEFGTAAKVTDPAYRGAKIIHTHPPHGDTISLGAHWEEGGEVIYIVSGMADALNVINPATGEKRTFKNIKAGSRITINEGIAHQLIFSQEAVVVALNEEPFSPTRAHPYPGFDEIG